MGYGHLPHHVGMGFRQEFTRVPEVDALHRSTSSTHSNHLDSTLREANQITTSDDRSSASYERDSEEA